MNENKLPPFNSDGFLPPGDYELTEAELANSHLVLGSPSSPNWDTGWREKLCSNLANLTDQLRSVGITEIFIDGSFVEDKDHPNDIDGYFECDLQELASGKLQRQLNLLDPYKVWTWDPASRRPHPDSSKRQLPMWHRYRVELYPHSGQSSGLRDQYGHELTFPSAFRQARDFSERGIAKLVESIMIRSEKEYQDAHARLKRENERLKAERKRLAETLSAEEVERALEPTRSFLEQIQEEMVSYERLKRGEFRELHNFSGLGELLIGLRIFRGLSQKDLADKLGCHESQISRDERNEYHNITLARAHRLLEIFSVELKSHVEVREEEFVS